MPDEKEHGASLKRMRMEVKAEQDVNGNGGCSQSHEDNGNKRKRRGKTRANGARVSGSTTEVAPPRQMVRQSRYPLRASKASNQFKRDSTPDQVKKDSKSLDKDESVLLISGNCCFHFCFIF